MDDNMQFYKRSGITLYRPCYKELLVKNSSSGSVPKSYVGAVTAELTFFDMPLEGDGRQLFEEYEECLQSVSVDLRLRLDNYILNRMVRRGKLSSKASSAVIDLLKSSFVNLKYTCEDESVLVGDVDRSDYKLLTADASHGEPNEITRREYAGLVDSVCSERGMDPEKKKKIIDKLVNLKRPVVLIGSRVFDEYIASGIEISHKVRTDLDYYIIDRIFESGEINSPERDALAFAISQSRLSGGRLRSRFVIEGERSAKEVKDKYDREERARNRIEMESKKRDAIQTFATLAIVSVVVVMTWSAFANWVNSQPDSFRQSDEKTIPGLGITASEYQRRSNCLNFGC